MRKFVAYELDILDFRAKLLYPILSNKNESRELTENFKLQAKIELNPKSFSFSKIISGLTPILEGFDEDPEESFFTEEEFRDIIQNALIQVEKDPIEEAIEITNDTARLQSIILLFIRLTEATYSFLNPEVFNFFNT